MTDKPKISHYAAADSLGPKASKASYPDRSKLAQLYPKPKTYEQRKIDSKLLQQSYRRRWPKYPYLNIAAYGTVLLGLMVWFTQSVNAWWYASSDRGITMSSVFFSFAIALGLVFAYIAWVNYTNKLLSYFASRVRVFWLIYVIIISIVLVIWLNGWIWEYTNILWVPFLSILHFILVLLSAQRIIRRTSLYSQLDL